MKNRGILVILAVLFFICVGISISSHIQTAYKLSNTYKAIEILMNYQYQLEKEQFELLVPYNYTETIDTVTKAQVIWAKNTLNAIGNNYCKKCDLGIGIQPCY